MAEGFGLVEKNSGCESFDPFTTGRGAACMTSKPIGANRSSARTSSRVRQLAQFDSMVCDVSYVHLA
jgi:hypothetical protein